MVLPSQSGRGSGSRRYMSSARRRRARWRWAVVIVLVCGGAYWFWPGGEGDGGVDPHAPGGQVDGDGGERPSRYGPVTKRSPELPREGPARVSAPPIVPVRPVEVAPVIPVVPVKPVEPVERAAPVIPVVPEHVPAVGGEPAGSGASASAGGAIGRGMRLIEQGRVVEGRAVLSDLLVDGGARLTFGDAQVIRETLTGVNRLLVFSTKVAADDPLAEAYTVASGDLLIRVAPRYNLTYQFIETINGIDARRIRVGQRIKVVRGPFHAVVDKSDYRMDMYLPGPGGSGARPVYICSFLVGLGEDDSTPLGAWVVRRGGKMSNPNWTNPRNGKYYAANDPMNPVGEHWIGLSGIDDQTRGLTGYGIHGTIEPESVGRSASMGCVRMHTDDVDLVYQMLVEGQSTVTIRE